MYGGLCLRGLARARLADDDDDLVRLHCGQQLVTVGVHGQQGPICLQLLKLRLGGRGCRRALPLLRSLPALIQVLQPDDRAYLLTMLTSCC